MMQEVFCIPAFSPSMGSWQASALAQVRALNPSLHPSGEFLKDFLGLRLEGVGTLVFTVAAVGSLVFAGLDIVEILHPDRHSMTRAIS